MERKKMSMLVAAALAAALALGGVGYAYGEPALDATPTALGQLGGAMHRAGGGLAAIVADLTGLDVEDVLERRSGGESFADIASSKGVDSADVEAEALKRFEDTLDERMTSTDPLPPRGGMRGMGGTSPEAALAELADLDVSEIRDRRADGESLAKIASAEGVDIGKVIDAVIADADERLSSRVDAGAMTEEQKSEFLAALRDRLEKMVESTEWPPQRGGMGPLGPGAGPGPDGATGDGG